MIFTKTSSSTSPSNILPTATSCNGGVVNARRQQQPSQNNAISMLINNIPTNKENDEDEKYHKTAATSTRRVVRRRKGKSGSVRDSIPRIVGITAVLCTVLLLWQLGKNSIQQRRSESVKQQRQRAADLIQARSFQNIQSGGGGRTTTTGNDGQEKDIWHKEFETLLKSGTPVPKELLMYWLSQVDLEIRTNHAGGVRWIRPYLLPPLKGLQAPPVDSIEPLDRLSRQNFFEVYRKGIHMDWEDEWETMKINVQGDLSKLGPAVDYTDKSKYSFPTISPTPPPPNQYPPLRSLKDLMLNWPQDDDFPGHIKETLMHFNYSDPAERAMAQTFRDNEVPFKFYDVPELDAATLKWTDQYVANNFKFKQDKGNRLFSSHDYNFPPAQGKAQESTDNYFAFFNAQNWEPTTMGLAPVRNSDWDFAKFAEHARYADAKRLSFDQPHFYWQSGVPRDERYKDYERWSFISRDLPSLSSPNETFFVFHPELQKGIQCRFGERGVVAATHYDGGRNHVAMISGAKRYILSPPRECSNLGIFTHRKSPIYRHSLLNFGHIKYLQDDSHTDDTKTNGGMTAEERAWLEKAGQADALETVLKAGEVLYIPSHWFHYIISLQKSAQCNVRAGMDLDDHPNFGGMDTVEKCEPWPSDKHAAVQ